MPSFYDERNTLFARVKLDKNSDLYKQYYQDKQTQKKADDAVRGFSMQMMYDAIKKDQNFKDKFIPMMALNDTLISQYHDIEKQTPINQQQTPVSKDFKTTLKAFLNQQGVKDSGVVALKPHHHYTHFGKHTPHEPSSAHGKPIKQTYQTAIIFMMPMDMDFIRRGPDAEEMIETLSVYEKIAHAGMKLSVYLRQLGYDARFESVQYGTVPLVPLAYEAGLGEIGMSNHLVHKTYGDAIRLGAVLTNLPLAPDSPTYFGLEAFCKRCALCMMNCPNQSITHKKRDVNGIGFYQFDDVSCFKIWKTAGTDCGICIYSCPFSYQIDVSTIDWMKNDPHRIDQVIKTHLKTYTRRPRRKTPNPLVKG